MIRRLRIESWAVFDKNDTVERVLDEFWTKPFEYLITEIDDDVYGVARLTSPLFDEFGFRAEVQLGSIAHLLTKFEGIDAAEFRTIEGDAPASYVITNGKSITAIHDSNAAIKAPVAAKHYVESPTDFLLQPTVDQALMAVLSNQESPDSVGDVASTTAPGLGMSQTSDELTWTSEDLVWVTDPVDPDPLIGYGVARTEVPFRIETRLTVSEEGGQHQAEDRVGRAADLDGKRVDFQVEVRGPATLARVLEDGSSEPVAETRLSSGERTCTLMGCDPFRFEVTARSHGTVAVIVSLYLERQPVLDGHELTYRVVPSDVLDAVPNLETLRGTGERTNVGWARSMDLQLRSPSDGLLEIVSRADELPPFAAASSAHDIESVVNAAYARLDKLSAAYNGGDDGRTPTPGLLAEVARLGAALHEAVFGHPDVASVDAATLEVGTYLARQGRNGPAADLYVDLTSMAMPWAIVYDANFEAGDPPTKDTDVDPLGFWGTRFRLARAARRRGGDEPSGRDDGAVKVQAFVNRDITPEVAVERQTKALGDLARTRGVSITTGFTVGEFEAWVRATNNGSITTDFLYLYCHATAAARLSPDGTVIGERSNDQARIELGDSTVVSASEMAVFSRSRLAAAPPLAMVNACSAGRDDAAFPNAFVDQFVNRWGMRALVASDSQVPAVFAAEYGDVFLRRFLDRGTGVAEAVRASTHALVVANGNPLGLLFSVHGDPDLRLKGVA